jgi:hypothetical protein
MRLLAVQYSIRIKQNHNGQTKKKKPKTQAFSILCLVMIDYK